MEKRYKIWSNTRTVDTYTGETQAEAELAFYRFWGHGEEDVWLDSEGEITFAQGVRCDHQIRELVSDSEERAYERCAYCECDIAASELKNIPSLHDDEGWARVADDHRTDCEWVHTRAHRLEESA